MKLPGRWMFSKVKISDIVNSLLNLAEIKFYKVGLVLPCLLWVLQTLNLACYLVTPWVIAWCLALKCTLEPRLLTKILLFWATLKVSSTSAREELFTCFYHPWQQLHIFTHSAPFHLVFNRWQCFTVSVAVLSTKSYMLHLIKLMNPWVNKSLLFGKGYLPSVPHCGRSYFRQRVSHYLQRRRNQRCEVRF